MEREGHAEVPIGFETDDGHGLGQWVRTQRLNYRQGKLSGERIQRLEELGFDSDPYEAAWEEGYRQLQQFIEREGHAKVPGDFETNDGYKLHNWSENQRSANRNGKLSDERIRRLEELGFDLDPHTTSWEKAYALLAAFLEREGHADPPRSHVEDGFKLGSWCLNQRYKKDRLSDERIARLDALGFRWKA